MTKLTRPDEGVYQMLDFSEVECNEQRQPCVIRLLLFYPDTCSPNINGLHDAIFSNTTTPVRKKVSTSVLEPIQASASAILSDSDGQTLHFFRTLGTKLD